MEEYNHQLSENTISRSSYLYGISVPAPSSSMYGRNIIDFHLQSANCYDKSEAQQQPTVKTEAGTMQNHGYNFHYTSTSRGDSSTVQHHFYHHHRRTENEDSGEADDLKAKIIAHPQYSNLLNAYMDCQKVGAPPEVVARLTAVRQEFETRQRSTSASRDVSKDPELDQFMEGYYDMLVKHRDELTRPLHEVMEFMRQTEKQLSMLTNGPVRILNSEEKHEGEGGSSEEDHENSGETELPKTDPKAEERELKNHLLRKYSGYLSSLKQQLSKKKKKGKLPKDARQKLLDWWELHDKWPYPSESEKLALAESTGLDQKQINNWFINQRKRHWKPSEDMQFMVMDGLHPQNALYMEGHCMSQGPYILGP